MPTRPPPFGGTVLAFTLLLAALTALTALSIDMSLPALPVLQQIFHARASTAQLTLSVFLAGYAIGQLVNGPLSDSLGRRPVLLAGTAVFTVAGLACAASPSLPVLIIGRLLQGLGASAGPILARAMVRDCFTAHEATAVLSHITQVMMIAPLIAPTIGGYLVVHTGWRVIFLVLGGSGLLIWLASWRGLAETRPPGAASRDADIDTPHGAQLWQDIRSVAAHPASRRYGLVACLGYSGMFAYISGSPFVYMDVFGVSKQVFGVLFALTAASLMLGATVNRKRLHAVGPAVLLRWGVVTVVLTGIVLAALSWARVGGLAGVVVPMMGFLFGLGLAMPNATGLAMAPHGERAGVCSSLIGGLQTAGGALAGYCVGVFFDGSPASLVTTVAVLGILTAAAYALFRSDDANPLFATAAEAAEDSLPLVPDEL